MHILSENINGKLIILGEYQVLEKKGIAIVKAITKGVKLDLEDSDTYVIKSNKGDYSFNVKEGIVNFSPTNENMIIQAATSVVFSYLQYKKIKTSPFIININSQLETSQGIKYGFGSSAAIISGIIKVILAKFLVKYPLDLVFKLSVLAQLNANKLTSGADLAAVIYQSTVFYQRYDLKYVLKHINKMNIVEKKWPSMKIIPFNTNLNFKAIWTKESYTTEHLDLKLTKRELLKAKKIVSRAFVSIKNNNYHEVKKQISEYQIWLNNILKNYEEKLLTSKIKNGLKILDKYNLAGKISGAGGGDSLIFMYPEFYYFDNLEKELNEKGFELIEI